MHGKTIDEMYVGQFALLEKKITDADVYIFAGVTGDMNPVHLDDLYASCSIFQQRIAHGGLVSGLFSTVLGTVLPGIGTIYLKQESKFVRPVFIDDTVHIKVEVTSLDPIKNRATLSTIATNQHNEKVIIGEAVVMPPRKEESNE
ncbi:MaoC family dehydratase [Acholeplasma granularum]|uniref:MaoC family dehydratase n=1 Tax=Acholeplasma granularum TaxID=264635 RepID=UPI00047093AE|nr:MaoC family dehydratase [Acholeplasma granularum]